MKRAVVYGIGAIWLLLSTNLQAQDSVQNSQADQNALVLWSFLNSFTADKNGSEILKGLRFPILVGPHKFQEIQSDHGALYLKSGQGDVDRFLIAPTIPDITGILKARTVRELQDSVKRWHPSEDLDVLLEGLSEGWYDGAEPTARKIGIIFVRDANLVVFTAMFNTKYAEAEKPIAVLHRNIGIQDILLQSFLADTPVPVSKSVIEKAMENVPRFPSSK